MIAEVLFRYVIRTIYALADLQFQVGETWRYGETVGYGMDMNRGMIWFTHNGRLQGSQIRCFLVQM